MRLGVAFEKGHKKSRHFLTVTGNKEYVCPYRFDINRKSQCPLKYWRSYVSSPGRMRVALRSSLAICFW